MRPDARFVREPQSFWANVRTISQSGGYTVRGAGSVRVFSVAEMVKVLARSGLGTAHVYRDGAPTALGRKLADYFSYRADVLNTYVEPRLMDVTRARAVFEELQARFTPACPIPSNKQTGDKAGPAYLTAIVNMMIEHHASGHPVDYNPGKLTTITRDDTPLRTLSRRVDGAFPGTINPIAIWEIKEYYFTTTFGSRIADGVYETQLDGMELQELKDSEGIAVEHLLIVDSHYTWWQCGRSYLCRIIDMLHMGHVDEVLFGYEAVERLPDIVRGWVKRHDARPGFFAF